MEGLLSDVLSDASARQWRARAATFRAARPTPADYPGERSIEDLREQWRELSAVAAACEARAHVLDTYPHEWPEVAAVLTETRDEAA